MRRFQLYGLSIASELDLLLPKGSKSATPNITITRADPELFKPFAHRAVNLDNQKHYRYESLADGSSYLSWHDLFQFLISSDGRLIRCDLQDGNFPESYISYLLSFAMSFALLNMGEEAVHATVIELGGRGIGFLGDSGAGKSTLASYFLTNGAKLVTDDLLRITFSDEAVIAHPGPQRLKLLPESVAQFMQGEKTVGTMNPFTTKKLIIPAAHQSALCGVPLETLYLLNCPETTCDDKSPKKKRLRSPEAVVCLIASTFNAAVRNPKRLSRQLQFSHRILSRIPLFRLSYPRDYSSLHSVHKLIVSGLER